MSSLFLHQLLDPGPSDPWMFPLTDSSYDSLENELDNSSGGSPGFCNRRLLRPKALQGSLESILTFSDEEHDTYADINQAETDSPHGLKIRLGRTRGRRQDPDLSCPSQHRLRRCSEPSIAYRATFGPCISESTDGLDGEEEDGEEELFKKTSSHTQCVTLNIRDVSSSSLSSNPNSPAPTRSSLDSLESLHSLGSEHTWVTKRGLHPNKTHLPSNPSTTSTALPSGGHADLGTCPKGSPPKEPLSWGTLKGYRGLHPNSWLRKGRRLSLTQQDNLEKEEEDKTGVSLINMATLIQLYAQIWM